MDICSLGEKAINFIYIICLDCQMQIDSLKLVIPVQQRKTEGGKEEKKKEKRRKRKERKKKEEKEREEKRKITTMFCVACLLAIHCCEV